MNEIRTVSPSTAALYEKFTYPRFRYLLKQENQDFVIAVGLLSCGQPAGLCLLQIDGNGQIGIIHSLFIVAHLRKMGLGRELLLLAENKAREKSCSKLAIRFNTEVGSAPPIQTMLQRCGWQEPELVMEYNRVDLGLLAKEKWIYRCQLPASLSIVPWPPAGSAVMEKLKEQTWYPAYASPFMDHPLNIYLPASFLLYRGEEIAGWVIAREFQTDTLVAGTLFVKEELQGTGRGIMLLAEAIKAALAAQIDYGIFVLLHESHNSNRSLLRFSERRLKPFSQPMSLTWRTYKRLSDEQT